jgi:hypothetical protein
VDFDGDDTVISKGFMRQEPTGFFDRVLGWLGL